MRVSRGVRDKTKLLLFGETTLFGDETWHGQHSVVIEAGQLADRWTILKGDLQQTESSYGVKMANLVMAGSI